MKTLIFVAAGLAVGLLGGTAYGGLKERDVLLAEMEAQEEARRDQEEARLDQEEARPDQEAGGEEGTDPPDSHGDPAGTVGPASEEHAGEESGPDGSRPDVGEAGTTPGQEAGGGPVTTDNESVPSPESVPQEAGSSQPGGVTSGGEEHGSGSTDAASEPSLAESEGTIRLAGIFGAMEAKDAAKVLQNLDDEEVQAILFHLSDRKAAEILGNFEPARAATLSRAVLGSRGGEDS